MKHNIDMYHPVCRGQFLSLAAPGVVKMKTSHATCDEIPSKQHFHFSAQHCVLGQYFAGSCLTNALIQLQGVTAWSVPGVYMESACTFCAHGSVTACGHSGQAGDCVYYQGQYNVSVVCYDSQFRQDIH